MPLITGVKEVEMKLNKLLARYAKPAEFGDSPSVAVGYTAKYSLKVHEDLTALHGEAYNNAYINSVTTKKGKTKHSWTSLATRMGYHLLHKARPKKPDERAKYLEEPVRKFRKEVANIIAVAVKNGATLARAMFLGGLRFQRESQLIVPVDTGHLRASAFTVIERRP